MVILAVPAAGVAAFFVALLIACRIHEAFKNLWSAKRIDHVSVAVCFVLLGFPAYVMMAFDGCSLLHALMLHLGIGCVYVFVVLAGVANYVEGLALAIILSILLLFLIPVAAKLRSADDIRRSSAVFRSMQLSAHSCLDILGTIRGRRGRIATANTAYQFGERECSARFGLNGKSTPRTTLP